MSNYFFFSSVFFRLHTLLSSIKSSVTQCSDSQLMLKITLKASCSSLQDESQISSCRVADYSINILLSSPGKEKKRKDGQ